MNIFTLSLTLGKIVLNFISPNQVQMLKLFAGTDHETRRMLVLHGDRKMLREDGGERA